MLRVAGVASIVSDHLTDIKLNKNLLVTIMLLHDMGNILKFDLSKPDLLDSTDQQRIDQIKSIQNKFKNNYSSDCDLATLSILKELGVGESGISLCRDSHGSDLPKFLHTNDWDKKISFYSDMRVGPFGIVSLDNRFQDLINRYPDSANQNRITWKLAQKLEHQIQLHCSLDLSTITDATVAPTIFKLQVHSLTFPV